MPRLVHLHRLTRGDDPRPRRRPSPCPQCARPVRDRLRALHVLRHLRRRLPVRRPVLDPRVRVRRVRRGRADPRARAPTRMDVDRAAAPGARSRRRATTRASQGSPVTAADIVIAALGVVAVGSGVLVVTTRQIVHAALWLVVCFGALAASYVVLAAEFVAWVQVLIYVGAVVVLLLFGVMLTRAPIGRSHELDSGNRVVALITAVATAAVLVTTLARGFRDAYFPLKARVGDGSPAPVGASLFRSWVLPFEALSVLLLAALVGAIVLSRSDIGPHTTDDDSEPLE